MNKEEYVEWVKNWKIRHEALVKLQCHVKKYQIKTVYKQPKYKLSAEGVAKCIDIIDVGRHSYIKLETLTSESIGHNWRLDCIKSELAIELHDMYTKRVWRKEDFKNSMLAVTE